MYTLQRLNVVRQVETEKQAKELQDNGFKLIEEEVQTTAENQQQEAQTEGQQSETPKEDAPQDDDTKSSKVKK